MPRQLRALVPLRLRRLLSLPLFLKSLSNLLPRHDSLVLCNDFFSILGQLVAFFRFRPEIVDPEAIVQVRSKIIHEPDWEHKADAELLRKKPKSGNAVAVEVKEPYLEDLELNTRHFELGLLYVEYL